MSVLQLCLVTNLGKPSKKQKLGSSYCIPMRTQQAWKHPGRVFNPVAMIQAALADNIKNLRTVNETDTLKKNLLELLFTICPFDAVVYQVGHQQLRQHLQNVGPVVTCLAVDDRLVMHVHEQVLHGEPRLFMVNLKTNRTHGYVCAVVTDCTEHHEFHVQVPWGHTSALQTVILPYECLLGCYGVAHVNQLQPLTDSTNGTQIQLVDVSMHSSSPLRIERMLQAVVENDTVAVVMQTMVGTTIVVVVTLLLVIINKHT